MSAAELSLLLETITVHLADIMSFGLGGLTGIAFVIAAAIKWS